MQQHAARRLAICRSLSASEGLEERRPIVNCTTCHRGQLKPVLSLSQGDVQTAPGERHPRRATQVIIDRVFWTTLVLRGSTSVAPWRAVAAIT